MTRIHPIFGGVVEQGVLRHDNPSAFSRYLQTLKGRVDVIVKRRRPIRSDNQNRWWHGVILPLIAEETGNDPETVCLVFRTKFLPRRTIKWGKKHISVPLSTADLDKNEFGEFIEQVRAHSAQELGITIPDPQLTFTE